MAVANPHPFPVLAYFEKGILTGYSGPFPLSSRVQVRLVNRIAMDITTLKRSSDLS